MNLSGLESLASTLVAIVGIVLVVLLGLAIAKGQIAKFLGVFACALLATAAVVAVLNYERVGPAVLALVGL